MNENHELALNMQHLEDLESERKQEIPDTDFPASAHKQQPI